MNDVPSIAFRPPAAPLGYVPLDHRPAPPPPHSFDDMPFELSVGNVAFLLDEPPERIRRLIKDGILKAERYGRQWGIKASSAREVYHLKRKWLAEQGRLLP